MCFATKIIATNLILCGAIVATAGTAVIAFAMNDPLCRDKIKDCTKRLRDQANSMCNRSSNGSDTKLSSAEST